MAPWINRPVTEESTPPLNPSMTFLSATVERMLGVTPGVGARLGLSDDWAYNMIKTVGNYGEIYDRTVGEGSRYQLPRGLNNLWNNGGILNDTRGGELDNYSCLTGGCDTNPDTLHQTA